VQQSRASLLGCVKGGVVYLNGVEYCGCLVCGRGRGVGQVLERWKGSLNFGGKFSFGFLCLKVFTFWYSWSQDALTGVVFGLGICGEGLDASW
jgi:hypothetical protein